MGCSVTIISQEKEEVATFRQAMFSTEEHLSDSNQLLTIQNGQIKVLFLLIWKIGMRKGETLSTTWADIIYDEKHSCYILPLDGKTGKRSIPLSYETHEMMVKLSPTTKGNLIEKTAYNQINRTIIEVCKELNIKSFTPKDLRTKRANELAIELLPEAYMEWMGHGQENE